MSESANSPEESPAETKLLGKHKWRMKLFSPDGKSGRAAAEKLQSNDEDIAHFLHTTSARPEVGPPRPPLVPRTDAAAAYAASSAAQGNQDHANVDAYRGPRARQNKGLHVRFESKPPEVIGVGGDEAELPSRDVSASFAGLLEIDIPPSKKLLYHNASDQSSRAYGRSTHPHDEDPSQRLLLTRRPTGVDDEVLVDESHQPGSDREVAQSTFPRVRNVSPRPRDEEQRMNMDGQKGHAMDISLLRSTESEASSFGHSQSWQAAENSRDRATRHVNVSPPEVLSANFLAPSGAPKPLDVSLEASSSRNAAVPATKALPKLPSTGRHDTGPVSQDVSHSENDKPLSLRTIAQNFGDESLDDFDSRVRRFNDLFQLNASAHTDIMAVPFERWITISAWWFLKGREALESAVRRKPSGMTSANAAIDGGPLKQAYVNLAKAWWVLKYVTPNLPEIRRFGSASLGSMVVAIRSFSDQPLSELVGVQLNVRTNMRALATSMKRNGMLPPGDLQMQGLDLQLFVKSPVFPSEMAALMVNNVLHSPLQSKKCVADPFFPILVADTTRHFCFGKMFVDLCLDHGDDATSSVQIHCVVSILRERTDWAVKVAIASQDGQVNLVIQSDEHGGLHWHDVHWKIPLHTMQLRLAEDFGIRIKFSEKDFKTIWGICDYTQQIRKEYSGRRGEQVLCERELPTVQCFDSPSFPAEPMKGCRVRLFEKREENAQHKAHHSYRLMVITNPGTKTLSKANYELGKDMPLLFSTHQNRSGNTLLLRVPSSLGVSLTFREASDVGLFRSILAGSSVNEDDQCSASLQLHDYAITLVSNDQDAAYGNASRCISDLRWQKLRVVSRHPPPNGHDLQSDLRILAECDSGVFTDRINAGPGELQMNLSVGNLNEFKLLRAAQQDMTWSFTDGTLRDVDLSSLSQVLHSMSTSPSVRRYHFGSLSDLHCFQAMVTGFHVLYDGLASTLSISRPHLIALHKRWEANAPRLQVVQRDKTVQLVAFFKDISHGACMNFVLKETDFFEIFSRSGQSFLRIVDAKFALPKSEADAARDFVCLDMPEYPGEHDDITIGFDSQQDRDRFTQVLPAPVNQMSRMASLRR